MKPLFDPGYVVATASVALEIDPHYVNLLMERHLNGDWGDLDTHDFAENERSLREQQGGRLHSSYDTPQGSVWIITDNLGYKEACTTVLLPSDY